MANEISYTDNEIQRILNLRKSPCVVLHGLNLPNIDNPNEKKESDFLIIDKQRKYILSLEIKYNLFPEAIGNVKIT